MSKMPGTQQQLLSGLIAQDSRAQRALVTNYLLPLQDVCVKQFGLVREDAEEIALDVLRELMGKPERFDESLGHSLYAWLKRVASHRALDRIRQLRRTPAHLSLNDTIPAGEKVRNRPRRTAVSAAIASAVVELPHRDREILEWYLNAIPYGQLASWTGRSEGNLRQIVCRAKRQIRQRVGAQLQIDVSRNSV